MTFPRSGQDWWSRYEVEFSGRWPPWWQTGGRTDSCAASGSDGFPALQCARLGVSFCSSRCSLRVWCSIEGICRPSDVWLRVEAIEAVGRRTLQKSSTSAIATAVASPTAHPSAVCLRSRRQGSTRSQTPTYNEIFHTCNDSLTARLGKHQQSTRAMGRGWRKAAAGVQSIIVW